MKKVSRISKRHYTLKAGAIQLRKLRLDAQAVGEEIERLRVANGTHFDNRLVVEAARDPKSAMHAAFDWDNETAGEKWRLRQAAYLVASVEAVIITPERPDRVTRAFVSTANEKGPTTRHFTSTEYAMNDPDLRAEVLRQALRELAALKRKYVELSELADIFAAIDSTAKMVG